MIDTMAKVKKANKLAAVHKREPTAVITLRLPRSLHAALKAAASEAEMSMNAFCIKLLNS